MIKLILSDMDGTLLDEHGNLPVDFDEVMQLLDDHNILFAPASGRQYYMLLKQFAKYRDKFVFIAENGTCAVYKGKELFHTAIPSQQVASLLLRTAKIPDAYTVLCGLESAYILASDQMIFEDQVAMYYDRYKVVESFNEVNDDILKIAVCDLSTGGSEYNSYPYFADCQENVKVVVSGALWMDIMNSDVNKGIATQKIQQRLGIKPEECMAFGDYLNDLEMMSAVRYSYAMANAHPKVRQVARFQAKSNSENGVFLAIREMLQKTSNKQK